MRGDGSESAYALDYLVPDALFDGAHLASGHLPSPYQQKHSSNISGGNHNTSNSWATIVDGTVQVEKSLTEVCFPVLGGALQSKFAHIHYISVTAEQLKLKLKDLLREKSDSFNLKNPQVDKVRLGEAGWKERYYEENFSAKSPEDREAVRKDLALKYIEGLCWVMNYYYEGVCSWLWYYPYHYAPFASDLKDITSLKIRFELGAPFKPFNQLLGILPAASAHALPEQYRKLMTDPKSPLIDFYPSDFEVDMNGKRFFWQGVAKLPFIDEQRLLSEVEKIEHTLTKDEAQRNSVMSDMLFVSVSHTLSPCIISLYDRYKQMTEDERVLVKEQIDPGASGGMNGYLSLCAGDPRPPCFPSPIEGMENILKNQVISAVYSLSYTHKHITRLPEGIIFPEKTVDINDINTEIRLWHQETGRKPFDTGSNYKARGAVSGSDLGHAAHLLISNSLHITDDSLEGHEPQPFYLSNNRTIPEGLTGSSSSYSHDRHLTSRAHGSSHQLSLGSRQK